MKINIPRKAFNEVYLPLLDDDQHRYMVLYGGAGSGKSVFAVQRFIIRLLTKPMCNLLVVRSVGDTNRDSTFALFKQIIRKWKLGDLFKITDSNLRIRCVNGNSVIFKGLDDTEKLKSITFEKGELTEVWVEEASEVQEEDFNQLDVRLRGLGAHKQIVVTFNPISVLHWLKKRFYDKKDPRAVVMKTTYKDNRFLDEDYKKTLEGYRESDPYYYSVYCLGQWGVLGKTIFHAQNVNERLAALEKAEPPIRGEFVYSTWYDSSTNRVMIDDNSIRFVEMTDGPIAVYRKPTESGHYVLGGDTAGEGSDFYVGAVIDNATGEQVCVLRGQYDDDLYGDQMYCLGKYYNTALIAIEANFTPAPIRRLELMRYTKMYVRQAEDDYTHKVKTSFGFKTTSVTRPLIIAGLVEVVREHPEWIYDPDTLNEMLTFVRNDRGRAEAEAGAHDDCIMALAIAYYCREQQPTEANVEREWTSSMYEDYERADPETKAMLRRKWGKPKPRY